MSIPYNCKKGLYKEKKRMGRGKISSIWVICIVVLFSLANKGIADTPILSKTTPKIKASDNINPVMSSQCDKVNTSSTVSIVHLSGNDTWTIEPFIQGFSLLEQNTFATYGFDYDKDGVANFPTMPVKGSVTDRKSVV